MIVCSFSGTNSVIKYKNAGILSAVRTVKKASYKWMLSKMTQGLANEAPSGSLTALHRCLTAPSEDLSAEHV